MKASKEKLIANKEMYFGGRMLKPDEEFDCESQFVDVLLLAQAARKAQPPKRAYRRRDMVAETP